MKQTCLFLFNSAKVTVSESTDNPRQADMVIAKYFFIICILIISKMMTKIEKKLDLILSSIDDLKLRISSIEDKLNCFDKRITKNENQLYIIEKTQENFEKSVQNLQAEVQQIAKD